jgi:tRNA threonylcarbamoyladenosine biosynthesis protein TsaE
MKKTVIANNYLQTQELANSIFNDLKKSNKACVIALSGDLGGGKTAFCQGLAKACGIKEEITSPTFVIFNRYNSLHKFKNFYHFDCYRLESAKDVNNLGFKEIINNPDNLVAIEWAEIIKDALPKDVLYLKFEFVSENQRKIETINNEG